MCPFCTDSIENEQHFVYKCPLFYDLRTKFLGNACNTPLIKLIEDRNKKLSRVIAKYLFHAIKRRQQFVDSKY
jgi:hypothetical protein